MKVSFTDRVRTAFAPPEYLMPPLAGIDLSSSGVKAVRLERGPYGLVLARYADVPLANGAFANGDVVDRVAVVGAVASAARIARVSAVTAALPEAKSYLFEAVALGEKKSQWVTSVEQHVAELVPLPPQLSVFDIVPVGRTEKQETRVVGVGF
ncbi:MAG: hypothetical protein WC030_01520, partial [Candidatus Paceibacterota bacterium]